jgi:hypothetical protein
MGDLSATAGATDEADGAALDSFANVAIGEGCDRVEAALWAIIAIRRGFDPVRDRRRFVTVVRRYVADRRAYAASHEILAGWLAAGVPPSGRPASRPS